MNAVHDMGGMHGFGPIPYEENEPVFHSEWESRVLGMEVGAKMPLPDKFRYMLEKMPPAAYLGSSYYERWLYASIQAAIQGGYVTQEDFDERVAHFCDNLDEPIERTEDPERLERFLGRMRGPQPLEQEVDAQPAFAVGDAVRTINIHPYGHTRLPQYAKGKRCTIAKVYGFQPIDDSFLPGTNIPTDKDTPPQAVCAVRFDAQELWGESAEANTAVYLDMWESYLIRETTS